MSDQGNYNVPLGAALFVFVLLTFYFFNENNKQKQSYSECQTSLADETTNYDTTNARLNADILDLNAKLNSANDASNTCNTERSNYKTQLQSLTQSHEQCQKNLSSKALQLDTCNTELGVEKIKYSTCNKNLLGNIAEYIASLQPKYNVLANNALFKAKRNPDDATETYFKYNRPGKCKTLAYSAIAGNTQPYVSYTADDNTINTPPDCVMDSVVQEYNYRGAELYTGMKAITSPDSVKDRGPQTVILGMIPVEGLVTQFSVSFLGHDHGYGSYGARYSIGIQRTVNGKLTTISNNEFAFDVNDRISPAITKLGYQTNSQAAINKYKQRIANTTGNLESPIVVMKDDLVFFTIRGISEGCGAVASDIKGTVTISY